MCDDSMAALIVNNLRLTGIVAGGYIGWKYGNRVKNVVCEWSPTINYYHDKYIKSYFNEKPSDKSTSGWFPSKKESFIGESHTFNMIGCMSGIAFGYYAWPIVVPVAVHRIVNDNHETINNLIKKIS